MSKTLEHPLDVTPELLTHVPPQPIPFRERIARALRTLLATRTAPARTYHFSDAYGGHEVWNPLAAPDLDVLVSTDFASRFTERSHREYDTFGAERVTDHFLRLVLEQHDELLKRRDLSARKRRMAAGLGTGVFINHAPRTDRRNGSPFWVATARGGAIRVVATPLESLSPIKQEIETLAYLPNPQGNDPGNGLYDSREQFRSRLTPRLLDPDHRLDLVNTDPTIIPDFPGHWRVLFVDRYGNVVTHVSDTNVEWAEIERASKIAVDGRRSVRLALGDAAPVVFEVGDSLGAATPGSATVYRNRNIDLVRRWTPEDDAASKLESSAYGLTGRPQLGTPVRVA